MMRVPPDNEPGIGAYVWVDTKWNKKLVIAVRGTTTVYDECADLYLWPGFSNDEEFIKFCSNFTDDQLDYSQQLLALYLEVKTYFHDFDVLITGHSLGSGLAQFISVTQSKGEEVVPSVVFSGPGLQEILENTYPSMLPLDETLEKNMVNFVDPYDPIYVNSKEYQVGVICVWNTQEPKSCSQYYSDPSNSELYHECFLESHYFTHLLELISNKQPFDCDIQIKQWFYSLPDKRKIAKWM
eukprot:TRINITY_DN6658_c0_g1_i4.p1 TRINITY_DN6658_c0_g1~~TRINITY_DN6658_c0_g1_i4.p1  ORF type:complete len:240 (+),score=41.58 TRINITY_DN6658_c0_g1_i4:237-956(+)